MTWRLRSASGFPQALYTPPGSTVVDFADHDPDRARILMIKIRLMGAFPINFSATEVPPPTTDPYASPATTTAGPFNPLCLIPTKKRHYRLAYQAAIYDPITKLPRWKTSTQTGKESVESAVCLMTALSVSKQGINVQTDELARFMQDTDGSGNKVLGDHWGNPFRFYRFATQDKDAVNTKDSMLFQIAPTAQVVSGAVDPLDPNGKLLNWYTPGTTTTSTNATIYDAVIHKRTYTSTGSVVSAQYAIPIIASAGPDGKFGLPAVDKLTTTPPNSMGQPTYAGSGAYTDMTPQPAATLPSTGGDEKDNLYSVKRPSS